MIPSHSAACQDLFIFIVLANISSITSMKFYKVSVCMYKFNKEADDGKIKYYGRHYKALTVKNFWGKIQFFIRPPNKQNESGCDEQQRWEIIHLLTLWVLFISQDPHSWHLQPGSGIAP